MPYDTGTAKQAVDAIEHVLLAFAVGTKLVIFREHLRLHRRAFINRSLIHLVNGANRTTQSQEEVFPGTAWDVVRGPHQPAHHEGIHAEDVETTRGAVQMRTCLCSSTLWTATTITTPISIRLNRQ